MFGAKASLRAQRYILLGVVVLRETNKSPSECVLWAFSGSKRVAERAIFADRGAPLRGCGRNGQYWSEGVMDSKSLYLFCARVRILIGVKTGLSANKWYICGLFYRQSGRFGQKRCSILSNEKSESTVAPPPKLTYNCGREDDRVLI